LRLHRLTLGQDTQERFLLSTMQMSQERIRLHSSGYAVRRKQQCNKVFLLMIVGPRAVYKIKPKILTPALDCNL